jgi:hypothetical protein
MAGIAAPGILILIVVAVLTYGIVMTVDAIRRRPDQYRLGTKASWVAALILLNPLLLRFFGAVAFLIAIIAYPVLAFAHQVFNRSGSQPNRLPP